MKIQFVGATGTVTGSRFIVEENNQHTMVDCGLFQGPQVIRQKNWEEPIGLKNCKAVVLTHAHVDHSGLLPLLPRHGFKGPIYCSRATLELCKILLPDAGRLQEEDAEFFARKRLSRHDPPLPLYTEAEAIKVLSLLQVVPDSQWVPLMGNLKFRLERSGHILGSRFVEMANEHRLLFSGDLGPTQSILLKEPVRITETDFLVIESTYGDRNHPHEDRKAKLAEVVKKVIGRGGTLLIPAFAVGRAQELLFLLRELEEAQQIPTVPVYLDSPMALDATDIYRKFEDELRPEIFLDRMQSPLTSLNFVRVTSADESMLLCMNDSPKIVISASGMLSGGRILHHLKTKLPGEKNGVLFVAYQVPGSKGELLKNRLSRVRIHGQMIDVEAEVFMMSSLSAHADSDEILKWCEGFRSKPRKTFIVHGEDPARLALAYRLCYELGWEVEIPSENQTIKLW